MKIKEAPAWCLLQRVTQLALVSANKSLPFRRQRYFDNSHCHSTKCLLLDDCLAFCHSDKPLHHVTDVQGPKMLEQKVFFSPSSSMPWLTSALFTSYGWLENTCANKTAIDSVPCPIIVSYLLLEKKISQLFKGLRDGSVGNATCQNLVTRAWIQEPRKRWEEINDSDLIRMHTYHKCKTKTKLAHIHIFIPTHYINLVPSLRLIPIERVTHDVILGRLRSWGTVTRPGGMQVCVGGGGGSSIVSNSEFSLRSPEEPRNNKKKKNTTESAQSGQHGQLFPMQGLWHPLGMTGDGERAVSWC